MRANKPLLWVSRYLFIVHYRIQCQVFYPLEILQAVLKDLNPIHVPVSDQQLEGLQVGRRLHYLLGDLVGAFVLGVETLFFHATLILNINHEVHLEVSKLPAQALGNLSNHVMNLGVILDLKSSQLRELAHVVKQQPEHIMGDVQSIQLKNLRLFQKVDDSSEVASIAAIRHLTLN